MSAASGVSADSGSVRATLSRCCLSRSTANIRQGTPGRQPLPVGSYSLQQARGSNKILRFKALGEFLIDRGEQSDGLGPAASRDPVRGKIGGDTQLEGQRSYGARLGERLLQPLFARSSSPAWKRIDASTRCSSDRHQRSPWRS